MLERKLVSIGGSQGIILPKPILGLLGWKRDDTLRLDVMEEARKKGEEKCSSLLIRKQRDSGSTGTR
jgi:antitoxin component of MazEF toxin-antitoxin module